MKWKEKKHKFREGWVIYYIPLPNFAIIEKSEAFYKEFTKLLFTQSYYL